MLLKKNILSVIFLLAFNALFLSASTQSFTDHKLRQENAQKFKMNG